MIVPFSIVNHLTIAISIKKEITIKYFFQITLEMLKHNKLNTPY